MGLDVVELFMAFEEEFDISIPDAEATELTTPRKVTDYVAGRVAGRGMTREQVAARVRRVVEKQTATYDFSDDDHFVHDMHLD
jgi:acyl carrier protein